MLVLTRKSGQKIILQENGKEIEVEVLKIQNGQVSLGFKAPDSTRVYRGELWLAIKSANEGGVIKETQKAAVNVRSMAQNLQGKIKKKDLHKKTMGNFRFLDKKNLK